MPYGEVNAELSAGAVGVIFLIALYFGLIEW